MAIYVGFYRVDEDYQREVGEKLRSGKLELKPGELAEPVRTKARELPQKLPTGCRVVGSWVPVESPGRTENPGVIVVETDDIMHLIWFNSYYAGLVHFSWHPYLPVARA